MQSLLWIGTLIGIPQMIPLMWVHSGLQAEIWAVPIGLMGGIATAAYYDLAIRACPAGLQGTLMLMAAGMATLSSRYGDKLGTAIYDAGGQTSFLGCVIATTLVYALILPLILLVPKRLMSTRDGEENPEMAGQAA